jgi:ABC-type sugar transport system substrate-binding protein
MKMRWGVAVLAAAICLSTSACGGASKSNAPATAGTSASAGAASSSQGLTAAQAVVNASLGQPTTMNLAGNPVLPRVPSKGIKVGFINCNIPACPATAAQLKEATDLLGWDLTVLTPDPSAVGQSLQQLVGQGFKYVLMSAVNTNLIAPQIQAAKAKGVSIIDWSTGVAQPTITAQNRGPAYSAQIGKLLADALIVNSAGDAHAVFATIPTYPIFAAINSSLKAELSANCSACKVDAPLSLTAAQLASGQIPSAIVAYLQGHSDVNYVVLATGDMFPGLSTALSSAGLDKRVKVLGNAPGSLKVELQSLNDGTSDAWTNNASTANYWLVANWVAQLSEGLTLTTASLSSGDRSGPYLITKAQAAAVLSTLDSTGQWPGPPSFQTQFKTLWRLS